MCRICGRMVKCVFDSMPSRVPSTASKRQFSSIARSSRLRSSGRHVSSGSLVRSALNIEPRSLPQSLPTFLLPYRSKLHQAAIQQSASPISNFHNTQPEIPPSTLQTSDSTVSLTEVGSQTEVSTPASSVSKPLVLSKSVQDLLPLLEAQKPHYITAHIHRFPYLITAGDTIKLPFHMHGVQPGDILRFNRASILGSRDYTLKAGTNHTESYDRKRTGEPNYIDERLYECRVRVMGLESSPLMLKEKTKRRNRKLKTVRSKHKYTTLKVMEIKIKTLDELKQEQGTLVLG